MSGSCDYCGKHVGDLHRHYRRIHGEASSYNQRRPFLSAETPVPSTLQSCPICGLFISERDFADHSAFVHPEETISSQLTPIDKHRDGRTTLPPLFEAQARGAASGTILGGSGGNADEDNSGGEDSDPMDGGEISSFDGDDEDNSGGEGGDPMGQDETTATDEHLTTDWFPGRDDSGALRKSKTHKFLGWVAVYPGAWCTGQEPDPAKIASWHWWRIVKFNCKMGRFTLYNTDLYEDYETAVELNGTGKVIRNVPSKIVPVTPSDGFRISVIRVTVAELSKSAIMLSPQDAVANSGDPKICSVCKLVIVDPQSAKQCDSAFPFDRDEPVLRCRRGYAHPACAYSPDLWGGLVRPEEFEWFGSRFCPEKKNLKSTYDKKNPHKGLWLCLGCRSSEVPSDEDLYGYHIELQSVSEDAPHPASQLPSVFYADDDGLPIDGTGLSLTSARAERLSAGISIHGRPKVQSMAVLEQFRRREHMGKKKFGRMLRAFHEASEVSDGNMNMDFLPRVQETVQKIGSFALASVEDLAIKEHSVDVTGLRQRDEYSKTVVRSGTVVVQELLSSADPTGLVAGEATYSYRNPYYVDSSGRNLCGPEAWHCRLWSELELTVPEDGAMICVSPWADKTFDGNDSIYSAAITVDNVPRGNEKAYCTMGSCANPKTRKAKGGRGEEFDEEQKVWRLQVSSHSMAMFLIEFEKGARDGVWHLVPSRDGGLVRKKFYYRFWSLLGDLEEQRALVARRAGHCIRCSFTVPRFVGQAPRTVSMDGFNRMCGGSLVVRSMESERRTRRMLSLMRNALKNMKTTSENAAKEAGVRALAVIPHANRLPNFIRHETGGYSAMARPDTLHFWYLGVLPKFFDMLMALFARTFLKSSLRKSHQDLRQLISERLAQVPPFAGLVLPGGLWEEDTNGIAGPGADGNESLFLVLFCVIAGCPILLPDRSHRRLIIGLYRNLYELHVRAIRGGQEWWADADLVELQDTLIRSIVVALDELQVILLAPVPSTHVGSVVKVNSDGGNLPGNGMAIPKLHELDAVVPHLKDVGRLSLSSTKPFEKGNVASKHASRSVLMRNKRSKMKGVLERLGVNEKQAAEDTARDAETTGPSPPPRALADVLLNSKASASGSSLVGSKKGNLLAVLDKVAILLQEVRSVAPLAVEATVGSLNALVVAALQSSGGLEPAAFGTRLKFGSKKDGACEVSTGHFVESAGGVVGQVLCCASLPGSYDIVITWVFQVVSRQAESGMRELKRATNGPGAVFILPAIDVLRRLHLVPRFAGLDSNVRWSPSADTVYVDNPFACHLEPIRGVQKIGPKPFRRCPRYPACSRLIEEPKPQELAKCPVCSLLFKW